MMKLFFNRARRVRNKERMIQSPSNANTKVGFWLKQFVVMSKRVALLRMRGILRRLYFLYQGSKCKRNFLLKQRNYYLLKGMNGLDKNLFLNNERLRIHRQTARLMNFYRKKKAYRRVFWLPYMQHGLKALSNGTTKRVRIALKFWHAYLEFLKYTKEAANKRSQLHFKKSGKIRGIRSWLHKHRNRMKRKRANTARLDLWNVTLQSYHFRVLYRIIAMRRRFRMVALRFKIGNVMDIWASKTATELRYRHCILEIRRRKLLKVCLKAIVSWRMFTKQQLFYYAQVAVIRTRENVKVRRRYFALWLHQMCQKEEALLCQQVYNNTCRREKHKTMHAWIKSLRLSRKARRNKCRAVFNVLCEYMKERQHKRYVSVSCKDEHTHMHVMLLMYYIFRFERNITGSNHYHNHLQSLAIMGFRQRHNQIQLSNEHGSQAYANMLQYLSRERIRHWNSRIKTIHRGCSELYVLFRTIFSCSLVEMVINSVLESEIQTTRSRTKDGNGAASPGLFIASALNSLGGDVSNCIYSIYIQYV